MSPNSQFALFRHGYPNNEAVSYSVVVYPVGGAAGGPVLMIQAENFRHVDGTAARKIRVQNVDPVNAVAVDILEMSEQF